ncbi:MAG: hypothetical protein JWM30_4145 [Burkholderia sp.]|nr:hypothetical protein [Burkholderia sp.]
MGKSGNFDTGTGELAPRTGEFLAGVLALSRISRVTVALESGHGAGPTLLAAARLTAHAETCVLFDQWHGDPLADLAAVLFHVDTDLAPAPDESLAQALRTLQARDRRSLLIIFDRFDLYLAQAADQAHIAAFDRAFVQMANDSELDVHFLLVQDESAESLLGRFQHDIPGISDGCLRMPTGGIGDSQEEAPAPETSRASRRDRSFGMLLERLTTIVPADETAASRPGHAVPMAAMQPAESEPPVDAPVPLQEYQPVFDDAAVVEVPPAAQEPVFDTQEPVFAPMPAAGDQTRAPMEPPAGLPLPEAEQAAPRRGKALALLMAAVLAVGAGFYAYRQQAPNVANIPAAPEAPAANAETASPPDVAAAPANTGEEKQPAAASPPLTAAPALAAESPAPATPAAVAAPSTPAAPAAASPVARTMPTVYVHVRSQRERDRLQTLARTLAAHGIRVVDVKVINKGPNVADLRYFRDEDKDTALTVQKAMVSAGVPVPRLSRMNGYEGSTRPGHFEAWLGGDVSPAPQRRR